MWEGPFGGIHQQNHAIDHAKAALDFTTEVGVSGRVNDVEYQVSPIFRLPRTVHSGVLGENGDTFLSLKVAGVHYSFGDFLVRGEDAGLFQHRVNQGGFPVVDVGDDGYIAEFMLLRQKSS